MTLEQHSSNHVTHKDSFFFKSEIGQWHPIVLFSQKIIAKTRYETYNPELLAIVEVFKT